MAVMRHNVEAAGVHLADCTLLMYQGELEREMQKMQRGMRPVSAFSTNPAGSTEPSWQRGMQVTSGHAHLDGEGLPSNCIMTNSMKTDYMYKNMKDEILRKQESLDAVLKLHNELRANIIDEWALAYEQIEREEHKHFQTAKYREKCREDSEWRVAVAQQHLADEAMLWAAETQELQREMDEGREAHRQSNSALKGRKKIK